MNFVGLAWAWAIGIGTGRGKGNVKGSNRASEGVFFFFCSQFIGQNFLLPFSFSMPEKWVAIG